MTPPLTAEVLAERYEALRRRVGPDVRIVAVTKTFGPEVVALAREVGIVDLGENYAQELAAKAAAVEGIRWHMIGPVQRNKVRRLADIVHLWHAIDRPVIVDELAKRAPGARLLVQVNTTGEATKAGCTVAEAPELVERARSGGLDVRGLMTVGPVGDPAGSSAAFASLRRLAEDLGLPELSMGMSGDLDEALAEGATMVRVGTALFGPRPVPA